MLYRLDLYSQIFRLKANFNANPCALHGHIMLWTVMSAVNYQNMTIIERLFLLRSVAIVIQLLTVVLVYFVISLQIALLPFPWVILVEALFHIFSILIFRQRNTGNTAILIKIGARYCFKPIGNIGHD